MYVSIQMNRVILLLLLLFPVAYANVTCNKLQTIYAESSCCGNASGDAQCLQEIPYCDDVEAGQVCIDANNKIVVKGLSDAFDFSNTNHITLKKSIIPDTNAQFDLGNAEYKIRHLYLSNN